MTGETCSNYTWWSYSGGKKHTHVKGNFFINVLPYYCYYYYYYLLTIQYHAPCMNVAFNVH